MATLGTKLRETRETRGLTLEEISTRTKIRQCYLEAIESDRLDSIPGGFFSRSFAKQYADALGVDADKIQPMLEEVTPALGSDLRLQKLTDYRSANSNALLPAGVEAEGTEFYHEANFLKERRSNVGWMAAAAVLVCASTGYLAWTNKPELFERFTKQTIASASQPAAQPAAEPPVELAKAIVPPVTDAAPEAAPENAIEPANTAAPVVVQVKAVAPTWLRLIADGRRTFGGTLEAGETRMLTGDESAVVFTGNAGGVELTYNGRSLGTPGPSGHVRTVVFTPANFEIRSNQAQKQDSPGSSQRPETPAGEASVRGR